LPSIILRSDRSGSAVSIVYTIYDWLRVSRAIIGTVSIAVGVTIGVAIRCSHFMPHAIFLVSQISLLKVALVLIVFNRGEKVDGKAQDVKGEDEGDYPLCEFCYFEAQPYGYNGCLPKTAPTFFLEVKVMATKMTAKITKNGIQRQ